MAKHKYERKFTSIALFNVLLFIPLIKKVVYTNDIIHLMDSKQHLWVLIL